MKHITKAALAAVILLSILVSCGGESTDTVTDASADTAVQTVDTAL